MLLCCEQETCEEKLKILGIVWETAWNEIRRDSSEMNPGWSLAPANQITTKGSSAWGNRLGGSYGLETPAGGGKRWSEFTVTVFDWR